MKNPWGPKLSVLFTALSLEPDLSQIWYLLSFNWMNGWTVDLFKKFITSISHDFDAKGEEWHIFGQNTLCVSGISNQDYFICFLHIIYFYCIFNYLLTSGLTAFLMPKNEHFRSENKYIKLIINLKTNHVRSKKKERNLIISKIAMGSEHWGLICKSRFASRLPTPYL